MQSRGADGTEAGLLGSIGTFAAFAFIAEAIRRAGS